MTESATRPIPSPSTARAAAAGAAPAASDDLLSVGVEEEFLLCDPGDGRPVPVAGRVLAAVPRSRRGSTQPELLRTQVEIASEPAVRLDDLRDGLRRLRHELARAAAGHGAALVAIGAPPIGRNPGPVTPDSRYQRLLAHAGAIAPGPGLCGTHVHIGVADADRGVQLINHLRPWLPVLAAMCANSPYHEGRDTGFASWRSVLWARWPSAGTPPYLADAEEYQRAVGALVDSGAVFDRAALYWYARLSEHVPTVEVRIGDVNPTVADTVGVAALVRALAATALREVNAGVPAPPVPDHLLDAAHWLAARHGVRGSTIDPISGRTAPTRRVVRRLVEYVAPQLRRHGDLRTVQRYLSRLRAAGTGADRQRAYVAGGTAVADLPRRLADDVAD